MIRLVLLFLLVSLTWAARLAAQSDSGPEYLYLWTASAAWLAFSSLQQQYLSSNLAKQFQGHLKTHPAET